MNQNQMGNGAPQQAPTITTAAKLYNVRITYPVLVDKEIPRIQKDDPSATPVYQVTILIPKTNQEAMNTLYATYKSMAEQNGYPVAQPGQDACPIKDGDSANQADGTIGAPHPGYFFVRTKSQYRPQLMSKFGPRDPQTGAPVGTVIADNMTVTNDIVRKEIESAFYSGVHVHAVLTPYSYNNKRKGVSFNPAVLVSQHTGDVIETTKQYDGASEFAGMFEEASDFQFDAQSNDVPWNTQATPQPQVQPQMQPVPTAQTFNNQQQGQPVNNVGGIWSNNNGGQQ